MSALRALLGLHQHKWERIGLFEISESSRVTPSQKRTIGHKAILRCTECGDEKSVRL